MAYRLRNNDPLPVESFTSEQIRDAILRGVNRAIAEEVEELRREGCPIPVYQDGKVVDISRELQDKHARKL